MSHPSPVVRRRALSVLALLLAVGLVAAPTPARAGTPIDWGACPAPGSPDDNIGNERYVVVASSSDDSASGGGPKGACTLRDAIGTVENESAENGCVVDEVGGPAKGDPWAIVLPAYTYTLDGTQLDWELIAGPDSFALCGQGAAVTTIRAAASPGTASHPVFTLFGGGFLRAWGVTISNGVAPAPSLAELGTPGSNGGGVQILDGFLQLHDSRLAFNLAAYHGGGLACALGTETCYSIQDSVIDHNAANSFGGGLYGLGYIESTIIADNLAGVHGGGLYTFPPSIVTLSGSDEAIGFNTAYMRNTLIASNSAGGYGGGWYNSGFGWAEGVTITDNSATVGGGLVIGTGASPTEYLANLTVSGNRAESQVTALGATLGGADYRAGGVWVRGSSTVEIRYSTIFGNENLPPSSVGGSFLGGGGGGGPYGAGLVTDDVSAVEYVFSIIAGNLDDGSPFDCQLNKTSGSEGGNRVGSTCDMTGIGDGLADPTDLLPLADNGGSTDSLLFPSDRTLPDGSFLPTHALVSDADMIDAGGSGESCVAYLGSSDQPLLADARGFGRYDGDGDGTRDCDIGAYEYLGETVIWIDGFEVEFTSPCNWSQVADPSLCGLK